MFHKFALLAIIKKKCFFLIVPVVSITSQTSLSPHTSRELLKIPISLTPIVRISHIYYMHQISHDWNFDGHTLKKISIFYWRAIGTRAMSRWQLDEDWAHILYGNFRVSQKKREKSVEKLSTFEHTKKNVNDNDGV